MDRRRLRGCLIAMWALGIWAASTTAQPHDHSHPSPAQPAGPAAAQVTPAPADSTQYWAADIQQYDPSAAPISVLLTFLFDATAGRWTGTLDVPPAPGVPGAVAIPFIQTSVTATELEGIVANGPHGQNTFLVQPRPDRTTATGRFLINGAEGFVLGARRVSAAEAAAFVVQRPQQPRPPFPYREMTVSFANPNDQITLSGTLTLPGTADAPGPGAPAVILVNDIGPHDRDRSESLHKLHLVLADRLTRAGIAVLRTDDRGVGSSGGDYNATPFLHFVSDVKAALSGLSQQQGIDAGRIGLLALGEGAPIAAAAANGAPVAFLALLSPQGLTGYDTLAVQYGRQLRVQGEDDAFIAASVESRRSLFKRVAGTAVGAQGKNAQPSDPNALTQLLLDAINADIKAQRGEWAGLVPSMVRPTAEQMVMTLTLPRTVPWLIGDPAAAYKTVRVPTLIVSCDRDTLLPQDEHLPPIRAALAAANLPEDKLTVRTFSGLNHQLQPAAIGTADEVIQIRTTIQPEALEFIAAWVAKSAGLPGDGKGK